MRTIIAITVIAIVPGCAQSNKLHRPIVYTDQAYNSPTVWQSFKSIRMARKKETPVAESKFSRVFRLKPLKSMARKNAAEEATK